MTGCLSYAMADMDGDGEDELFISYLMSDDKSLWVDFYDAQNGTYVWVQDYELGVLSDLPQVTLYLFENETTGGWQMFYSNNCVYRNSDYAFCEMELYQINSQIELVNSWEWEDSLPIDESGITALQQEIMATGVPYLNWKGEVGEFDASSQIMLAQIEWVSLPNDETGVNDIYLHIYNEEELNEYAA